MLCLVVSYVVSLTTAEPIGKQVLPVCWSHVKWTRDTTKDTTNSLKVSFLGHMGKTSVRLHSMTPQEYHKGHHKSAYKHLNSTAVYNSSAKKQRAQIITLCKTICDLDLLRAMTIIEYP